MKFKSDIEIARSAKKIPIADVAKKLGISYDDIVPYGHDKAKISDNFLKKISSKKKGKLILVTAINPTPAGEGKTTTTVGLGDGLNAIGKKTAICIREASLGPCFGMKGGAAGGGQAQVVPMEEMNLHFTGDFHAITSAHNLLSAMIDNHIYWGNKEQIDIRRIVWKRVLDMNDRALRDIVTSLGGAPNGYPRQAGFDITVASEVMAILCLADDLKDLKQRLGNIIIAYRRDKSPVFCKDIKADGAMTVLLQQAMQPNIVQTLENNPALVHGGPFANIAHGCNSVIATKAALNLATVRALKMNGGITKEKLGEENLLAVEKGCDNLGRHIENLKSFGIPVIIAINHFISDTENEISKIKEYVLKKDCEAILCKHWEKGSEGTIELAKKVAEIADNDEGQFSTLYPDKMNLLEKIETICKKIYRADEVIADKTIRDQLQSWEENGYGNLPVCMAKTQYSFTTDPNRRGAPTGHSIPIREVRLSAGAGFIVVVCGDIMTMPGLPKIPSAENIYLNENSLIEGLF